MYPTIDDDSPTQRMSREALVASCAITQPGTVIGQHIDRTCCVILVGQLDRYGEGRVIFPYDPDTGLHNAVAFWIEADGSEGCIIAGARFRTRESATAGMLWRLQDAIAERVPRC